MKFLLATTIMGLLLLQFAGAAPESGEPTLTATRSDGSTIHYYLQSAPNGHESDTLLISFQGSDCNSVKHDEFIQIFSRSVWPAADLLLVEKPGITPSLPYSSSSERADCPTYYLQTDTPMQRVDDASVVVAQEQKSGRYRNIIAMGGSEGATVAAMFTAESGIPDAVVLINGGGRWFLDDVLHNIRQTTSKGEVSSELEGFKGFAAHILETDPVDIEVSNHGYAWWRSMLTLDQQSVLNRIQVPTLVIQSGRDESVSPDAAAEMVEGVQKAGNVNIELMVYPELDHGLIAPNGIQMTKKVAEDIGSWLQTSLQGSPNKSMQPTADASAD